MSDERPPRAGGKRRRHVEGADTRALRGFEARDTDRIDAITADEHPTKDEAVPDSWDEDVTPTPQMQNPDDQRVIAAAWRHTDRMSRRINDRILELQSTVVRIEDAMMSAAQSAARAGTEGGILGRTSLQLEIDEAQRRLAEHDRRIVSISGEDGKNGQLGQVRSDLAGMRKIALAAIVAALGQVGVTIKAIHEWGSEQGAEAVRIERLERDVAELDQLIRTLYPLRFVPRGGRATDVEEGKP